MSDTAGILLRFNGKKSKTRLPSANTPSDSFCPVRPCLHVFTVEPWWNIMADAVYAIWNMHENAWTCWCCRASVEASIAICLDLCRCNWRIWEQCVWKSSPVVKRMPYVQRSAESLASKCVKHVGRNGVHQATAQFGPSQPKTVTRATIDSRYSPFDLKIDNANNYMQMPPTRSYE